MKNKLTLILFLSLVLNGISQNTNHDKDHPNVHKIVVVEVLQTTSYTYIKGAQKDKIQWMAVPKMEANKGETYYYHGGMEMGEFKSTELNRTFPSILFLNGLIEPDIVEGGNPSAEPTLQKPKDEEKPLDVDIAPALDGITIEELFSNKEKYANKVVKIKGKVTKFNSKIMSRNWVHLKDNTSANGGYDFTATTSDMVSVGDIITIEGVITLKKDFGAGYFYDIIMEEGKVIQ